MKNAQSMANAVSRGTPHAGNSHAATSQCCGGPGRFANVKIASVVLLGVFAFVFTTLSAGTIAFYPFTEGESGTSALNTTLLNAIDTEKFGGTSTSPYATLAGVKFSDDLPGTYLFDGGNFDGSTYVESFGSIEVWGRTNASGGALNNSSAATVSFDNLAEELSTHGSWTVEFFHKPAVAEYCAAATLVMFDAGYSRSGNSGDIAVYFADVNGFRGKIGSAYTAGGTPLLQTGSVLNDMRGTWSHFALTYDGSTGIMSLYHNYRKSASTAFTAGTAPEGAALKFANNAFRGKICALRVSDRSLKASEMLHASDSPVQTDLVWDLLLEGVDGEPVASDNAYVDVDGVQPCYVLRRLMKLVDNGVAAGITSNAVQLTVTPKSSSSDIFSTGPGLKVPWNASLEKAVHGSFTMEGYFKFDNVSWERKVSDLVIDGVVESRNRMTIMGQAWDNESLNQLWGFAFNKDSKGYHPRIDCQCDVDGAITAVTRTGSNTLSMDGKWHRYVVTYSQPTYTFVCYEDDNEVFRTTLPGDLSFERQGMWLVGTKKLGNHPFEGQVDAVRLTRGVLPQNQFRTMEKVLTGVIISVW